MRPGSPLSAVGDDKRILCVCAGAFEGAAKSRSSASSSSLCAASSTNCSVVVYVNWLWILDRKSSSRSRSGEERGDDVGDWSSSRRTLGKVSMMQPVLDVFLVEIYRFASGSSNIASPVSPALSRGVFRCAGSVHCKSAALREIGVCSDLRVQSH